jgi:hypothetical protein
MTKTGKQGLLLQSHKTFTSYQDARNQDATEAMVKCSSHEQLKEQMTFTKEEKVSYQDSGYSTVTEAMVKFGQTSPSSQDLAISLFTQDFRTQDAPEAMVTFSSHEKLQEQMTFPRGKLNFSRFRVHYCTGGYGQIWADESSFPRSTIIREGGPPDVACGNRGEGQTVSYQIPGIHVQHKSDKSVSSGIQTHFPL